jgi:hypothetical protein
MAGGKQRHVMSTYKTAMRRLDCLVRPRPCLTETSGVDFLSVTKFQGITAT